MKRLIIAAAIALAALLLLAHRAHATADMGSWWNMKDPGHDGWGAGIRQEIPLIPFGQSERSWARLALDTRASYLRFEESELDAIPLEAGGLVGLSVMYAEVGGGYYFFNADYNIANNWGWYAIGGVMLGKGPTGLFGEVKYTSLTTVIHDVKVDLGELPKSLDADGVGINVGISFGL